MKWIELKKGTTYVGTTRGLRKVLDYFPDEGLVLYRNVGGPGRRPRSVEMECTEARFKRWCDRNEDGTLKEAK